MEHLRYQLAPSQKPHPGRSLGTRLPVKTTLPGEGTPGNAYRVAPIVRNSRFSYPIGTTTRSTPPTIATTVPVIAGESGYRKNGRRSHPVATRTKITSTRRSLRATGPRASRYRWMTALAPRSRACSPAPRWRTMGNRMERTGAGRRTLPAPRTVRSVHERRWGEFYWT